MESTPPLPSPAPQPARRSWWGRNWKWFLPAGCFTFLVLALAFVATIVLVVFGAMKSSDVYKTAVARARANQEVMRALGIPLSEGMFLSGKTEVNGASGTADLAIPVSGPQGKGTIYVVANKSAGTWIYSKLLLRIEDSGETIDLDE